jgi:subtilisin family serine protease
MTHRISTYPTKTRLFFQIKRCWMEGSSGFEKLNINLMLALRAYEESGDRNEDDSISVTLRFEGELASIEALGFETHSVQGDEAMGVVRFKDIRTLLSHPGAIWMAIGGERRTDLDTAVRDISARSSTAANAGGLWHVEVGTGVLTAKPDATGAGAIVAIIDTGIDFTHPMFMKQLVPTKETRILRIWDQGLVPASINDCPDVSLLIGGGRYGVEFKDVQINSALNGGSPIAHKDCEGHGTHVAGIAAGGAKFPAGGDASKVGLAPEADIIAVKLLDTPESIRFKLPAGGLGAEVDSTRRFRDAVLYCLRTARNLGKPIVINMSFGNKNEAGDGLDDDARWVDGLMDPARPPGSLNFPTGAIVVKAAGNDGTKTRRMVARIIVPPGGQVTIPFQLKDSRGAVNTRWKECGDKLHKPPIFVSFWYRRNFDNVKFALRLPYQTTFSTDMGIGGKLDYGLRFKVGPPPSLSFVPISTNFHRVRAVHGVEPSVPHPAGGTVRRHEFSLIITPKVVTGTVTYLEGIYEVRVKAPPGTEIFVMGDFNFWGAGLNVACTIANKMADGGVLDPIVDAGITSEFSATDTLGQHVITVAAYDDKDGAADPAKGEIASFSSRGPLRDFSDPPGSKPVIATKPDLAAPGVRIESAQGVDTNVGLGVRLPPWNNGVRFIKMQGTSMAAPIVTGLVALMLDKNSSLNTTQVRTTLTTAATNRPGVNPAAPGAAHDRAYGSGMVDALSSHNNTP